jgi:hypothetical protein
MKREVGRCLVNGRQPPGSRWGAEHPLRNAGKRRGTPLPLPSGAACESREHLLSIAPQLLSPEKTAERTTFRGTEIVSGDLTPAQRSVQLSFGPALVLPDRSPGRLRQCVQRSSLSPLVA